MIRVAKEIQNQAAGELQMLTERFDLTEQQQAKIFPLLVQAAPGFGPGIDIGGINLIDGIASATGSPVDGSEILETPDGPTHPVLVKVWRCCETECVLHQVLKNSDEYMAYDF